MNLESLLHLPRKAEDLVARRLFGREHFITFSNYSFVYGRVPKAANSTLKIMLARLLSKQHRHVLSDEFWRNNPLGETTMLRTRDAAGLPHDRLVFTFVRNPLDRLASFYDNKVKDPAAVLPVTAQQMGITKQDSFRRVAEIVLDSPPHRMDVHVLPQSDILVHRGQLLPSFVGRVENLRDDLATLRATVLERGGPDIGEPRSKKTSGRPREMGEYYDERLIAAVKRKYEEDFRRFYPDQL
jgi:dermatan 4-sulfotransferase 1